MHDSLGTIMRDESKRPQQASQKKGREIRKRSRRRLEPDMIRKSSQMAHCSLSVVVRRGIACCMYWIAFHVFNDRSLSSHNA